MGKVPGKFVIELAFVLLNIFSCVHLPAGESATKFQHYDRIVAIGDVNGNYSGLVSIMKEAGLVDNENRWIGGRTLMVQTGDLLDQGEEVRKVMDLLMNLQDESEASGGKVVVIMGDHEAMNIFGYCDDVNPKVYADFAGPGSEEIEHKAWERWKVLSGFSEGPDGEVMEIQERNWMSVHHPGFVEYSESMGVDGHYGKWLRRLPVMFRYGGTVFYHAGISPEYADIPQAEITGAVATEIKQFDEDKTYLVKLGIAEQWFSMPEMMSVLENTIADSETGHSASLRDELSRLKEIRAFFEGINKTSPLMADNGPLCFTGFARLSDEQITAYLPEWLERNDAWRMIVSHTLTPEKTIQSRVAGEIFLINTGMEEKASQDGCASALEIQSDDVTAIYGGGERHHYPSTKIVYGPDHVWVGSDGTPLPFDTLDDIMTFLETADPVSVDIIHMGVSRPEKMLLKKDGVEVNAIFRHESRIDNSPAIDPGTSKGPRYFRDCYRGEIAAFEMNRLLGLNNMPPTVYRTINGRHGTLQLWAEETMTNKKRAKENILPPEMLPVNRQKWDMDVFDNLINNIDRHQDNILIDPNWRLILIDHTRTFARDSSLPNPEKVIHCSRGLWHSLRHLDELEVQNRLSRYLNRMEIEAFFHRRDLLVRLIQDLIDQKGEENVLF